MQNKYLKLNIAGIFGLLAFLVGVTTARASTDPNLTNLTNLKENPSRLIMGMVKGLGDVRIRIDHREEPVSSPIAISVELSCGTTPEFERFVSDFAACEYKDIVLDKEKKALVLMVKTYNPDTGKCTNTASKVIGLQKRCPQFP